MSKQTRKRLVIMGIGCVVLTAIAVGYSILYNDSRLVKPMDFSHYVFSVKDIPMIAAIGVSIIYWIYLLVSINLAGKRAREAGKEHTRKISPYLGLLGFMGFMGFGGFWDYGKEGKIGCFIYFVFFSFFSFFFEGKMSDTLKDELYRENERKAELIAYRVGFYLLFVVLWLVVWMEKFLQKTDWCAIILVIVASLIFSLIHILRTYLLYRYENPKME